MIMPFSSNPPGWYMLCSTLAGEGMPLFFVLSGFVIHYNYSALIRKNGLLGIYNFFVARFSRLYPLFFIGLLYTIIHYWGYVMLPPSFGKILPYYLTLTQSWFYIPFGKNALIYQLGLIPAVSWSVSTEWFFYLCYPAVCFALIRIPRVRSKIAASFILSSIVIFIIVLFTIKEPLINHYATKIFGPVADINNGYQDCFIRWAIYFSPYSRVNEFFLGCLTAAIYMQVQHIAVSRREEVLAIFMVSFSLVGIVLLHYVAFGQGAHLQYIYNKLHWIASSLVNSFGFAPFLAILIFCVSRYDNRFSRFFSHAAFIAGGNASYSIYLFHLVVLSAFSRDAAPVTSWPVALADLDRLLFAVMAIIGMGILSYQVLEVPMRRRLKKALTIYPKIVSNIN